MGQLRDSQFFHRYALHLQNYLVDHFPWFLSSFSITWYPNLLSSCIANNSSFVSSQRFSLPQQIRWKNYIKPHHLLEGLWIWRGWIGYFLDLPLILYRGDQLYQILAASTLQLLPQEFDLICRICHHLLCQILSLGESVFPSKHTFCSCLRSFSWCLENMWKKYMELWKYVD